MDWITKHIAIGNFKEAQDDCFLKKQSIRSVLGLITTLWEIEPADLGLTRIEVVPLIDGPGNDFRHFRMAVNALEELVRECPPVLVHCHAGMSRSPAVVAGYLMRSQGLTAEEAVDCIASRRFIAVAGELMKLLYRLE